MKRMLALAITLIMSVLLLTGCGAPAAQETPAAPAAPAVKSVNVAVTSTVSTINPLLMDASEVVKYTLSLMFPSLVELNADLTFVPQLADSITTEDNLTFTIKLNDKAAWSDGKPVTARDVAFTFECMTSPLCGNTGMSMQAIVGVGDDGYLPAGVEKVEGIRILDDKTLTVTTKWPVALYTFMNNYGRYVLPLPEHVLGAIPKDQLLTHPWFNKPDVVSGPYFMTSFDLNHYVRFEANGNYWQGAPKIKYFNVNVLESAQLLAGLKSGEIDLVQQTMGNILLEDYESVRGLTNIRTVMGTPVTNQSVFFNVKNVPDVRIRQALLCGIDRATILKELVFGSGEIVDGFLCSASPYYSADLGVTAYDPEKAKALIAEAKADGAETKLTWHVNSGDATFVQAASYIAATMKELGLDIEIKTVDFATLMTVATGHAFDVLSVEYTYAPVDPYTDMNWLLSDIGWTQYVHPAVSAALTESQTLTDQAEIAARYKLINQTMQQDVPMMSAYVISAMGAVSNRLVGAEPNVFGTFINVHEWDVQ